MIIAFADIATCYSPVGGLNFTAACEAARNETFHQRPDWAMNTQFRCGAKYDSQTNASLSINSTLEWCRSNYGGWQRSTPSQWASTLIGFLLPSLVFITTIPTFPALAKIPRDTYGAFIHPFVIFFASIMVVFALLGPILAGAIYELIFDWQLMKLLKELRVEDKRRAITLILLGSYRWNRDDDPSRQALLSLPSFREVLGFTSAPETNLPTKLVQIYNGKSANQVKAAKKDLHLLMKAQHSFGKDIGVPIIIFIVSLGYALWDAGSRRGDSDTAFSIAFGLWYSTIAVTAIGTNCIIGAEPVVVEYLFGSNFQVARIWERKEWILECFSGNRISTQDVGVLKEKLFASNKMTIRFFGTGSVLLIATLQCILAIVVCYHTPSVGFGCRSVTVLVYLLSQSVQTVAWSLPDARWSSF